MKVSVNILTWNCLNTLRECLAMLHNELKLLEYEVIVIDQNSIDDTQVFMEGHQNIWTNITYIRNEDNLGISMGKNQAIDISKGEYIFMVDADIVPVKNSVIRMIQFLEDNREIDAVGMHPNKWIHEKQSAEDFCHELVDPRTTRRACLYYGLFRKIIFDIGLRMDDSGVFFGEGYGWEDHDFYETMHAMGIDQYMVHINSDKGRYYHEINSSIRQMGRNKYLTTSKERAKYFHSKWGE